jgi:hypothetical protein
MQKIQSSFRIPGGRRVPADAVKFQSTPNILVCSDETKIGGYRVEGQA